MFQVLGAGHTAKSHRAGTGSIIHKPGQRKPISLSLRQGTWPDPLTWEVRLVPSLAWLDKGGFNRKGQNCIA